VASEQQQQLLTAAMWGGAIAIAAGFMFGLMSSQFFPIFGNDWLNAISDPFSPYRRNLIPIHLIAFVPTFAVFGAAIGAAIAYFNSQR